MEKLDSMNEIGSNHLPSDVQEKLSEFLDWLEKRLRYL